jgi:hypothetical protein
MVNNEFLKGCIDRTKCCVKLITIMMPSYFYIESQFIKPLSKRVNCPFLIRNLFVFTQFIDRATL